MPRPVRLGGNEEKPLSSSPALPGNPSQAWPQPALPGIPELSESERPRKRPSPSRKSPEIKSGNLRVGLGNAEETFPSPSRCAHARSPQQPLKHSEKGACEGKASVFKSVYSKGENNPGPPSQIATRTVSVTCPVT
jgi:hypothetical protein